MSRVILGKDEHSKAVGLDLPTLLRTRMLVAASSGGGKSWTLRRLLEQASGKVQQIVLDYEGEFATLREKHDFVLVGKGGEIAADVRYGPQLCRRLLELGVSAIIDLYELRAGDRHAFVKVFLEALINLPKDLWKPCIVIVDEAHVFAPEKGKGESEASGAVIDLATRGRKRGYCAVLATQDIAKLNKDASGECRNRLVGLAVEDKTRKRAGDELGFAEKEMFLSLRDLGPGEFYAFGPAIGNEVRKVQIGSVQTSHPDVGTKAGRAMLAAPPPPPDKVRAILSKLADLPKEAEEERQTVQALNRRIRELEREARQRPTMKVPEVRIERVEVPILKEAQVGRLEAVAEKVKRSAQQLATHAADLHSVAHSITEIPAKVRSGAAVAQAMPAPRPQAIKARPVTVVHRLAASADNNGEPLGKGERAILAATAQHPEGVTREQLTVLTGYKRSSRDTYLQRLQSRGAVQLSGGRILVTQGGIHELGPDYAPLPVGGALKEHWLKRLPTGERTILDVLVEAWPNGVDRDAISEATGYKRSSRDTYLQRLSSRELVTSDRGSVRASDMLFD